MWSRLFCCCCNNSQPEDKLSTEVLKIRQEVSTIPNAGFNLVKTDLAKFLALDPDTKLMIAKQIRDEKKISEITNTDMQLLISQLVRNAEDPVHFELMPGRRRAGHPGKR